MFIKEGESLCVDIEAFEQYTTLQEKLIAMETAIKVFTTDTQVCWHCMRLFHLTILTNLDILYFLFIRFY